jgi:DNA-binding beta-propeller fold protein YncE
LFALPDVTGFNQPEYMAYVPETNELWVSNVGSDNIAIIDVQ